MKLYFYYILIIFVACSVLYISWLESPRLSLNNWLPEWITDWTDKNQNQNSRTAIPFIFISIITGIKLIYTKATYLVWVIYGGCFIALVFLAEVGQLFIPLRAFDWGDIFWGCIPIISILSMCYLVQILTVKS